ncbi:hypothetical protein GCWU000341_01583 [Oribacterium sp. oral taxon 078 str. F0262]|nr:hypothetical protein GCWU000341_01583 [Oribacterium sp. oral taxon 078 str. F0262]
MDTGAAVPPALEAPEADVPDVAGEADPHAAREAAMNAVRAAAMNSCFFMFFPPSENAFCNWLSLYLASCLEILFYA